MKDLVPGGIADNRPDEDFDPIQLSKGIKVEMEHTENESLAKEIAKDHLAEFPDYYSKLEFIEKGESMKDCAASLRKIASYLKESYGYRRRTFYSKDPFWMKAKYEGKCSDCKEVIKKGDDMWYYPIGKHTLCKKCGESAEAKFLEQVQDEEFLNRDFY